MCGEKVVIGGGIFCSQHHLRVALSGARPARPLRAKVIEQHTRGRRWTDGGREGLVEMSGGQWWRSDATWRAVYFLAAAFLAAGFLAAGFCWSRIEGEGVGRRLSVSRTAGVRVMCVSGAPQSSKAHSSRRLPSLSPWPRASARKGKGAR